MHSTRYYRSCREFRDFLRGRPADPTDSFVQLSYSLTDKRTGTSLPFQFATGIPILTGEY